jgi:hypothetical protein
MDETLSNCICGYLHDYRINRSFVKGVEEICSRCKDRQFFRLDTPNIRYLERHIRQAIQSDDSRYLREYATRN